MGTIPNPVYPEPRSVWRTSRKTGVDISLNAGAVVLFGVTGDVIAKVLAVCKTGIASAIQTIIETGVNGNTAAIIPQLIDARDLDTNEIWQDASPTASVEAPSSAVARGIIISNGQDISVLPSGVFSAGLIDFYCTWKPLSVDGNVVAA